MKKRIVRILTAASVFAMAMMIAVPEVQAAGTVKSVEVSNLPAKTLTLKKGKSKTLKASVKVTGKASKKVTWKSSNKKIATVSSKGKVTAKKNGKAKVTVTSVANKKKKATITVSVGTPVTKVSLNKKSEKLYVGQSTTVKASVSPSKASNKKVVWTSSKASVAKVSSSGVVKAVKAGSATITAAAADGSGKKATFKVTVLNPVTIADVKAIDSYAVQVTLSEAQALTKDNFSVKKKDSAKGEYVTNANILSVETSDNKTYLIVLKDNSKLYEGDMVQVTVSGLNGSGTLSAETMYTEGIFADHDTVIWSAELNKEFREYFGTDRIVADLPAGLKYNPATGYIYGTPTTAGKFVSTETRKYESGSTRIREITWLIADQNSLVAAADPCYYVKGTPELYVYNSSIEVQGGSGAYTYAAGGDTQGFEILSSGAVSGKPQAAGTYTIPVKVTDQNNPALTQTVDVVFHVLAGRTIKGTVTDSKGNPVPYALVEFVSKDQSNKYGYSFDFFTDKDGRYESVVPDGTYTINVMNDWDHYITDEATGESYYLDGFDYAAGDYNKGELHIFNFTVSGDITDKNFTLPYTMTKVKQARPVYDDDDV